MGKYGHDVDQKWSKMLLDTNFQCQMFNKYKITNKEIMWAIT